MPMFYYTPPTCAWRSDIFLALYLVSHGPPPRRVLTEDATKTVMQSLVMSRLDYCNALLIGIQQDLIAKLQRLQNSAARIVSRTRKYEHITPVLIKLHWLPIKFRIQFKVLLLVYKALNGLAPKYIKELLVPYKPRRHLRSEAKGLLDEPRTRLKFGDRAFSISAPRLWNALPQHLKDSTSCQAFKKCLKTHLFRLAHWGVVDYYSNYANVQRFWTFYEWKRRYINSNYYYYYYYFRTLWWLVAVRSIWCAGVWKNSARKIRRAWHGQGKVSIEKNCKPCWSNTTCKKCVFSGIRFLSGQIKLSTWPG